MAIDRARIVSLARSWVGTPYHHQAAVKGAGCDCLGLIRGVWTEIYGAEPEQAPPYTPDWGEYGEIEHLLDAARRHLVPVDVAPGHGDVIAFRMREGKMAKHVAIVTGDWSMVHARSGVAVIEEALTFYWRRHIVGVFAFPGLVD